jgi:hypothetical protein
MLKLYGFPSSNYVNMVQLALLEKGVPFEFVLTYPSQTPEFFAKSPRFASASGREAACKINSSAASRRVAKIPCRSPSQISDLLISVILVFCHPCCGLLCRKFN